VPDLLATDPNPDGGSTDADPGTAEGIAVVGVDDTNGTWQFSIDGGATFQDFVNVAPDNALLLTDDPTSLIRRLGNCSKEVSSLRTARSALGRPISTGSLICA
jgi:hypothetical protein